jgi:hypothetical protein
MVMLVHAPATHDKQQIKQDAKGRHLVNGRAYGSAKSLSELVSILSRASAANTSRAHTSPHPTLSVVSLLFAELFPRDMPTFTAATHAPSTVAPLLHDYVEPDCWSEHS